MTSLQSTLGDADIAEELAAGQRQISIAEFFEKNKHMLGFDSEARALVTATKEAIDNSLTWSTPFVYREDGETKHEPIGRAIDRLIDSHSDGVTELRDGDLQKLRIDGMEALSFDDEYDVGFQRVSSVFRHRVNSDIYRITVEGGRDVELTDYHSVFVLRDGGVQSVETSDIERGDYVVLPDTTWAEGRVTEIDLVDELLDLPPEETTDIGLYGIRDLIDDNYDVIRDEVHAQYRISDFRKCDRLPLDIVRELELEPDEYRECDIGYRFGRNRIPAILPVTSELAELLGLYAAEGSVTGGRDGHAKVYLSFGSHERSLIRHAESLIADVFGLSASTVDAHDTAVNVTIHAKIIGLLFERLLDGGTGALEKRIPRFVFDFPAELRERFVLGFAAGDGYPTESIIDVLIGENGIEKIDENRITLSTSSDQLSSGLRYLLSSIGYDTTHELTEADRRMLAGHETSFGESHLLHLRPDQSQTSLKRLPASQVLARVDDAKLAYNLDNRRQSRVDIEHAIALADGGTVTFTDEGEKLVGGDLTTLPVTDIERIEYDGEWVYDVSVPDDENFMAGTAPVACHNSLDATEEAGFLPDIYVEIRETGDYFTLIVEDNGPGITKAQIPKIFGKMLYGSRFHKREQSLTPDQQLLVKRDSDLEFIPIGIFCDAFLRPDGADIAPISEDIEIPSFNRETHELTWQPVTHAIRHETDESTYRIKTEKGRTVEITGNHSLFGLTKNGETKEVNAAEIEPGDTVLTPRSLPRFDSTTTSVNILEHISVDDLEDRRLYVYGFERETLSEIQHGETIRKKPADDSPRERYYYRYNGVDILKESLTQYLEKGYLPVQTVIKLGWEEKAADCEIISYKVGGEKTSIPVTIPISKSLMELVAHYISEGHAGDRQLGFTFGAYESELVSATERAVAGVGGSTTTVPHDRNSTRVKAFGSPLTLLLKNTCGDSASEKRIPSFIFKAIPKRQRQFIAALHQGDGSDSHPNNELSHSTTSQTLARQLSILWNMQGVLASTETVVTEKGYAAGTTRSYVTKVYGEDVNLADVFTEKKPPGEQQYKRVPTSLLDDVRVGTAPRSTVPDTIPGLLFGAGIGSSVEFAAVYHSVIEDALSGTYVTKPRFVHNLKEKGLLDRDHQPTERLEDLWEVIHNLQGITESDMCLLPVKEVEETEPPEYVYDISVPGATGVDENFVVANEGALSVKNSRGQQGIGISAAVLYSQLTSGAPAKITSRTPSGSEAQYFELIIDTEENEPEIQTERTTAWERPHGTRIELQLEANMRARTQLHDYVTHTAVVNPHARIELVEPDAHLKFDRATDQLPKETEEIRPHPHGVELGTVLKMLEATESYSLSGFLQGEFTRVGKKTANEIIDAFRDHHYGREMSFRPPGDGIEPALETVIKDAVANKAKNATRAFADAVVNGVGDGNEAHRGIADRTRITHAELATLIDAAADQVETEFGTTFGATVRENARTAAWNAITDDPLPTLYPLVDDATTSQKDDAVVNAFSERLATRFENPEDHRHRLTQSTVSELVDWAADRVEAQEEVTFGETARENVTEKLWSVARTVPDDPPKVRSLARDRDAAAALLSGMRDADIMAPPTSCLSPITDDLIVEGLKKAFDADFYAGETRDAEVHGGDPFIVEAGIAYGGDIQEDGRADLLRFANRVPLVYQQGACAVTDVVKGIGWRNYGLDQPGGSGLPQGPAVIMVHVASTNVPFTSESKDAIANIPEIEHEIELAIRGAARDLKSYLNKRRSLEKRQRKQDVIATILPRMAEKLAEVTGREPLTIDDSVARIMNNVLVERRVDNGTVQLVVENNTETQAELDVTEIVSIRPEPSDGASVVEMDGEWFVKWSPSVASGDEAVLEYTIDGDATFDCDVDGIESEKLTINA